MNLHLRSASKSSPPRHSAPSLTDLVARIKEDDTPRWMVAKDGLDHGPFSGREIVAMIVQGEALGEHNLTNIDTGEQSRLSQYPLFSEFVVHYRDNKAEQSHKAALERAVKVERFGNLAKVFVVLAFVAIGAIGATVFVVTRQNRDNVQSADDLATLYERGEISLEGTANVTRPGRGARGKTRRGALPEGASQAGSYEEAMNQAVDLGDISKDGAMTTLDNDQVATGINRRMRAIQGCVSSELRAGNRLGRVNLDLVVAGTGNVIGVSVRAGSALFRQCVASEIRQIRFPSFSAPRTSASFSFNVN
ncbi:MAG: hypothetical protein H6715_06160 [Myxococcales bacterium]|nr:hypothetical protein [Myxococcales bacterium]